MGKIKKFALRGVIGFTLAAGLALGWNWWSSARYTETTDNAYIEADMSVLAPKVAGYVREIRIADNEPVRAGDVLLVIDDRDYTARLEGAKAQAAAKKAALAAFGQQIKLQNSLIAQAEANLASARAEDDRARDDLARYEELVRQGTVSRQRRDRAFADHEQSQAALIAAQATLAAERQRLVVLALQIEEAEADLAAAQSDVALAEIDLENTVMRAPVNGVIGNKQVEVGQYLRPGMQVLAVVPLPHVHVVANFKETQVAHMRVGQPVTLTVDAFGDAELAGTVESFAPASGSRFSLLPPENATGNFTKIVQRVPVRIRIDPDSPLLGALRPGLSVVAAIDTRANGSRPDAGSGLAAGIVPHPRTAHSVP